MQADDQYKLYLDSANPYNAATPVTTTLVEIGQQYWFKGWRSYYHKDSPTNSQGKYVTDWLNLDEGKFYKLRGMNRDTGGGMWSTVSLEFEKPGSEKHPMAAKAIQSWRIEQNNVAEQWTISVTNPSSGQYKLGLKSPKETTTWISDSIPCNTNAEGLKYKIGGFFSSNTRTSSDISVSLVMYDAANAVTTSTASAKKYVYTIKLKRRITGFSFTAATVYPVGTITSTVTVVKPSDPTGIASSAPLAGNFIVSCTDKSGIIQKSPPINYN